MQEARKRGTQENRTYSLRPSLTRRVMIQTALTLKAEREDIGEGAENR